MGKLLKVKNLQGKAKFLNEIAEIWPKKASLGGHCPLW